MSDEIELPQLVVRTGKNEFRLRCHAAAWAAEYGGTVKLFRGHTRQYPGLLLLSATGADTAAKSVRATLWESEVQAEFVLHMDGAAENFTRACSQFGGKPVGYTAAVAKLAPGVVHLVALARIPGLMPNLSDDHLWTELSGPRYTTPMLRSWTSRLRESLVSSGGIVAAKGYQANVGVLKTEPEELDELISKGVKDRLLYLSA